MNDRIGNINSLFARLKTLTADVAYAGHIRTHMQTGKITFAELNFTEEEFEAEERRALVAA